jgi:hypothetical protein
MKLLMFRLKWVEARQLLMRDLFLTPWIILWKSIWYDLSLEVTTPLAHETHIST